MYSKLLLAVFTMVSGHFAVAQGNTSTTCEREKVKVLAKDGKVLAEFNATAPNLQITDLTATLTSFGRVTEKGFDIVETKKPKVDLTQGFLDLYLILEAQQVSFGDPKSVMPFYVESGIRFSIKSGNSTFVYMVLPDELNQGAVCNSIEPLRVQRH